MLAGKFARLKVVSCCRPGAHLNNALLQARPARALPQRPVTYFAGDGLHPSSAAYRYCFDCLEQRLQRLGVRTEHWRSTASTAEALA